MKREWLKRTGAVVLASMLGFATPAVAQEKITLKIADSFPVGHYIAKSLTDVFMKKVTELTNGQVEFEYYPAQQLGKITDYIQLAQNGSIDIAYVVPALSSDKTPHIPVVELPGLFDTSCQGTTALVELSSPGGAAADLDFKPNGVRFVMGVMNTPVTLLTSSRQVKTLAEFEGLKVRTPGGGQEATVEHLGGVSVRMGGTEMYQAISRGTVDALLIPIIGVKAYDLQDFIKFATIGPSFGSGINMYVINEQKYAELPENVQKAITEAGRLASENSCKVLGDNEGESRDALVEEGKLSLLEVSADEVRRWDEKLAEVRDIWVKDMDQRDKSGTPLIDATVEALK